jgi:hypothetical protein
MLTFRFKQLLAASAFALVGAIAALPASAAVVRIGAAAFTADAGLITFSEKPLGSVNPTYNPADYGGGAGAPVVTFGGYFTGQSMGGGACGGAPSGCVVGTPSAGLSIAAGSPQTFITNDGANPTSPVLSGSPIFNGPIAVLFSVDLAGVGLDAGFFNAIGGTAITAFDRAGNVIGSVANVGLGIEFLGLVTADGANNIAGLLFSLVGAEPAGFAIDNLRFGRADQIIRVPEPGSLALLAVAMIGMAAARRRTRPQQ